MDRKRKLVERLRRRIVGRLHVGHLQTGDRLTSIRELARETGIDHRAVASAYRILEDEGLVEIRPGSGVYVAGRERTDDAVLAENVRWLTEVWTEAWERRMPPAELLERMRRSIAAELQCACVESTEDHMVAVSAELEEDFDFDVAEVYIDPNEASSPPEEELRGADLIVTTAFHARPVRAAAERLDLPVVVTAVNPEMVREINRALREAPVTAVIADPRFGDRIGRHFRGTAHEDRIRALLAAKLGSPEELDREEQVLITRAARRRLGVEEYHLLPPPLTFIAPESARELMEARVRISFEEAE